MAIDYGALQPQVYMIFKVVVAAILGGAIGYYRRKQRAGVRTISIISAGSTLFTLISIYSFPSDPARFASNIVTGIGFIGAGVIWKQEKVIGGITTAASIWVAAAIGIAVAVNMWLLAFFSALMTMGILKLKLDRQDEDHTSRQDQG